MADPDSIRELDPDLSSVDPLSWERPKPYRRALKEAGKKSGQREAVVTAVVDMGGRSVALGAMDFGFIGGSMGSAVGEKIVRLVETAGEKSIPLVISTASGGARMQEGMVSLMQMAKTASAVDDYRRTGLPYLSILTHPTTGGVLASFASLGDLIIAEPGAQIGFAGPRVIEQTINQKLPPGFQRSELLLDHGLVDMVVPRLELRSTVGGLLDILAPVRRASGVGHGQV